MFWKKHIPLSHETPTYDSRISGHGPRGQKNVKNSTLFDVFFGGRNLMWSTGAPGGAQKWKSSVFLSETLCFRQKNQKTRYFWLVLGSVITKQLALIFSWQLIQLCFFSSFPNLRFQTQAGKKQHLSKPASSHTNPWGNTAGGNTKNTSAAPIDFVLFLHWVSLAQAHMYTPCA